jgi:hypothetical protein
MPHASVAVATGKDSGLWVINVNTTAVVAERLEGLEATYGLLPTTLEARTGFGGRHLYFANTPTLKLAEGVLGDGITILSDGAWVVAPPSTHVSMSHYRWRDETPFGTPLASVPAWMISLDMEAKQKASTESHRQVDCIRGVSGADLNEASELYNRHNTQRSTPWLPFPTKPGPCPLCPGFDTFRAHPSQDGKWVCTSTQHKDYGRRGGGWWFGDVLDIDAGQRERTRKQHLEAEGYFGRRVKITAFEDRQKLRAHVESQAEEAEWSAKVQGRDGAAAKQLALAEVHHLKPPPETRSFASLCEIFRTPTMADKVFRGKLLEFNEMSGRPCLGGDPLTKFERYAIRERLELEFHDEKGNGLTFGDADIDHALDHVAYEHKFHPIRDYLNKIVWDGERRLDKVSTSIIPCADTLIIKTMITRWMIAAVARIFKPGCKVDTMLVLQGDEGINKSTFFSKLGGEWFADTYMDLHDKDAMHQLRAVWIYEWPEMNALIRAKDSEQVKSFITSPVDHYRPSHEPDIEDVPRGCVFGGTTNRLEFLTDSSGHRRFWPVVVTGEINVELLVEWRDQLWAEAAHYFHSGEQWWLTKSEEQLLIPEHEKHHREDPWEPLVITHLDGLTQKAGKDAFVTVQDLLEGPIGKEAKTWVDHDSKRVQGILRVAGWVPGKPRRTLGKIIRPWINGVGGSPVPPTTIG